MCACVRADDGGGEEASVDLLTCGSCRHQFPLAHFLQFVWHKVVGCHNRPSPGDVTDDVTEDRAAYDDVTHSPQPHDGDVSGVTSRAGASVAGR